VDIGGSSIGANATFNVFILLEPFLSSLPLFLLFNMKIYIVVLSP